MAGSWAHMVNDDGTPRTDAVGPTYGATDLEDGDFIEALEQCYGMIWWLAAHRARLRFATTDPAREQILDVIGSARENYLQGVEMGKGS